MGAGSASRPWWRGWAPRVHLPAWRFLTKTPWPGTVQWDASGSCSFLQLFTWYTTLYKSFCNLCQTPCLQGGQLNRMKPSYPQTNGKGWKARRLCREEKRKWHKSRGMSQTYSNTAEHSNSGQGSEICTKWAIYFVRKEFCILNESKFWTKITNPGNRLCSLGKR